MITRMITSDLTVFPFDSRIVVFKDADKCLAARKKFSQASAAYRQTVLDALQRGYSRDEEISKAAQAANFAKAAEDQACKLEGIYY